MTLNVALIGEAGAVFCQASVYGTVKSRGPIW